MTINAIIKEELASIIKEQAKMPEAPAQAQPDPVFSDTESKFLSTFGKLGTEYLGLMYSNSDVGVEEFIGRSGTELNLTMEVLYSLIKKGIVEVIPYGGYGRDQNFTIHLKIGVDNVKGLPGADDDEDVGNNPPEDTAPEEPGDDITDTSGGGADEKAVEDAMAAEPTTESILPEAKWHMNYEDVLRASAGTAKRIMEIGLDPMVEPERAKKQGPVRNLKYLPPGYLYYLDKIIEVLGKRLKSDLQREHLVADILTTLAHKYGLKPKQIYRAYVYYRAQNKLQNIVGRN